MCNLFSDLTKITHKLQILLKNNTFGTKNCTLRAVDVQITNNIYQFMPDPKGNYEYFFHA